MFYWHKHKTLVMHKHKHKSVQRSKIRQGINPRCANTLQTNRNIPVHELLLVSPTILRKYLSEVKFADRKTALQQRNKSARKKLLPFVTQYHPALPSLKKILMGKWHLIQNQQRLREIFKEPPLISYCKGKSLKDLLIRVKL